MTTYELLDQQYKELKTRAEYDKWCIEVEQSLYNFWIYSNQEQELLSRPVPKFSKDFLAGITSSSDYATYAIVIIGSVIMLFLLLRVNR